jgi:hypothetical protein
MGPGNLTGDDCEGPIAPAVPLESVRMDKALTFESTFRPSSLRRIELERPPSGLSWSL